MTDDGIIYHAMRARSSRQTISCVHPPTHGTSCPVGCVSEWVGFLKQLGSLVEHVRSQNDPAVKLLQGQLGR